MNIFKRKGCEGQQGEPCEIASASTHQPFILNQKHSPRLQGTSYLFAPLLQDMPRNMSSFPEKALTASYVATWKKVAGREEIGTVLLFCGSWPPKITQNLGCGMKLNLLV